MTDYGKSGTKVSNFFRMAAKGNDDAADFLDVWNRFNHDIDDIIDENLWDAEHLLSVFMLACTVYSHSFYRKHVESLQSPVILATTIYADSVKWEKDPAAWKRQRADVMRHSGIDVVLAVAMICGGWEHLRAVSAPLQAACYIMHKKDTQ